MMNSKTYDALKFWALAVQPIVTFICTVVTVCNVPYAKQITAILAAFEVLIGEIVVIAKKIYDKNVKSGMGIYGDGKDDGDE